MVFHWSLSDSKSPQVSRTLLSILAVLNNVVVWMVSTCHQFPSLFSNPLVTVPKASITIGIIVTCIFHSFFFNSLARSRYLSFFLHSFSFIPWSAGVAKLAILHVLFFLLIIIWSGLLVEIRWSICTSKLFTPLVSFTSVLADGFSLEFEWQQVSSSLQDSSQYSGRPQQCCRMDSLNPCSNFQVLQAF